ncbi:L-threonine dehydratase catabolic TdcB-like [Pocillopora verrucosa]|uniref:L-threonine dehydratase catabolic TdcB-like n=1 Tax=Pocillopora verrucosa TaxID=203993 RepID=UPI0027977D9B|nr:L-threonine dehydratase catabolic TdcB-like [Pocillopora verrucosa]
MESDSTSTLTDESEAILENETTVLFDQDCHVSLNPIVDESLSTLTPKSQIDTSSSNYIYFKPHTYGKRHSILGTGKSNISAFRKPDLAELKEKYNRAKEKFKDWNLDKLWGGRVERMKRVSSVSLSNIVTAAFWIREGVPKTPCERAASIPEIDDMEVYFKREYQNPSGSFYDRGARYALLRLHQQAVELTVDVINRQSQKRSGVIATSSGNHAIAIAYHGKSLGIPVTVLLPESRCPVKIRLCEKYDADITECGLDETAGERNDNPDIVSGQGTMGLEIVDQLEEVDAIIIPVGGGTLIAGTCIAVKTLYPSVKIIAVTRERSLDVAMAHHEGNVTKTAVLSKDLIKVDDMDSSEISSSPLRPAEDLMDKCITVKEDLIALALLRLLEYEKVILEADGAIGLAALLGGHLPELKGKRVVVVLTEANIEPAPLPQVIARGLATDGRLLRFAVRIDDRLATMATLLRLIASTGAVIKDVSQEPAWSDPGMLCLQAKVMAEVRDREHSRQLKSLLDQNFLVSFWSSEAHNSE